MNSLGKLLLPILILSSISPRVLPNPILECETWLTNRNPHWKTDLHNPNFCNLVKEGIAYSDSKLSQESKDRIKSIHSLKKEFKERTGTKEINKENWSSFIQYGRTIYPELDIPEEYNWHWMNKVMPDSQERGPTDKYCAMIEELITEIGEGDDIEVSLNGEGDGIGIYDCKELELKPSDCPYSYKELIARLKKDKKAFPSYFGGMVSRAFPDLSKLELKGLECRIDKNSKKAKSKERVEIEVKKHKKVKEKPEVVIQRKISSQDMFKFYGPIVALIFFIFPSFAYFLISVLNPIFSWIFSTVLIFSFVIISYLWIKNKK